MRLPVRLLPVFASLFVPACSAATVADDVSESEDAVVVDTHEPLAKAQYDADAAFARSYTARCGKTSGRPRVLLTGFGRFQGIRDNATGRIVSRVVPAASYPETGPAAPGAIDPPEPQTSVAVGTVTFPKSGEVDVCAMVLPVYWDLAAILLAKEIESFDPAFVMMNGVAGSAQSLSIELGSVNRAMTEDDGSDNLRPLAASGESFATIIRSAAKSDTLKGLLLSYGSAKAAANTAIASHADHVVGGRRFDEILPDAKLAGFPRSGNTYLCNNISYVTNYLMSNPGKSVALLSSSTGTRSERKGLKVKIDRDVTAVPRVFVHWPSSLTGEHLDDAADVMRSIIDAQLSALSSPEEGPIAGSNAMAEIVANGPTF